MPSTSPLAANFVTDKLIALGQRIRSHRKGLRVSATTSAEAAGMSRITLKRVKS